MLRLHVSPSPLWVAIDRENACRSVESDVANHDDTTQGVERTRFTLASDKGSRSHRKQPVSDARPIHFIKE